MEIVVRHEVLGVRIWEVRASALPVSASTAAMRRMAAAHPRVAATLRRLYSEPESSCPAHQGEEPRRTGHWVWYPARRFVRPQRCAHCGARDVRAGYPGRPHHIPWADIWALTNPEGADDDGAALCLRCGAALGLPAPGNLRSCRCPEDALRAKRLAAARERLEAYEWKARAWLERPPLAAASHVHLAPTGIGAEVDNLTWADPEGVARSHATPEVGNEAGLYVVGLQKAEWFLARELVYPLEEDTWGGITYVAGLLALSGIIVEHADGVLRASHAQIREIWVVENGWSAQQVAQKLRRHYDVLVLVLEPRQLLEHVEKLAIEQA